jgi:NADP-reducing hydrogenase subunit HndB
MPKLTVDDLKRIRQEHKRTFTIRGGAYRAKVVFHLGTCGIAAGARDLMNALIDEMASSGTDDVVVAISGCAGLCSAEPMASVEIGDGPPVRYGNLDGEKIKRILREHIQGGNVVEEYVLVEQEEAHEEEADEEGEASE